MSTTTLRTKKPEAFRGIFNINGENMPTNAIKTKQSFVRQSQITPPAGFMTGDEFERRVKERVTKFYKENGLL